MVDRRNTPAALADQLDLSLASVYEAFSYHDDHVDEIRTVERENEETARRAVDLQRQLYAGESPSAPSTP